MWLYVSLFKKKGSQKGIRDSLLCKMLMRRVGPAWQTQGKRVKEALGFEIRTSIFVLYQGLFFSLSFLHIRIDGNLVRGHGPGPYLLSVSSVTMHPFFFLLFLWCFHTCAPCPLLMGFFYFLVWNMFQKIIPIFEIFEKDLDVRYKESSMMTWNTNYISPTL